MKNNIVEVRTFRCLISMYGKCATVTYKSGTVRTYRNIDMMYGTLPKAAEEFMNTARANGKVTTNEYGTTTYSL